MYAALAPVREASAPWARLAPNSITSLSFAARAILLDFVAMSELKFIDKSKYVSKIEHSIIGAFTVIIGSFGNITEPSGKAQTSPVNLKSRR